MKIQYIATDGVAFDSESECQRYERENALSDYEKELNDWSVIQMAENKTCPFCGSNRIEVYMHYGESAGIQYGGYYPECTVCGCRLNYHDSREEALKAWNERDNHDRE